MVETILQHNIEDLQNDIIGLSPPHLSDAGSVRFISPPISSPFFQHTGVTLSDLDIPPFIPSIFSEDKVTVHAIAAIGESNQISLNNELPWHYEEDLELFKEKVKNKILIMGRVTYETFPISMREVSEIIIISKTDIEHDYVVESLDEALGLVEDWDENEVWICGGAGIYKEALERELIDQLHISHIPYDGSADRYFPNFTKYIYSVEQGTTIDCKDKASFVYKVYNLKESVFRIPFSGVDTQRFPSGSFTDYSGRLNAGLNWNHGRPENPRLGDVWLDDNNNVQVATERDSLVDVLNYTMDLLRGERFDRETLNPTNIRSRVDEAIRQADPSSSVISQVEVTQEANMQPVNIMGRYEPVAFDYGPPSNNLKIRLLGEYAGMDQNLELEYTIA